MSGRLDIASGAVEPLPPRPVDAPAATVHGTVPALSVQEVTKRWGRAAPVLDRATLELEPGAVVLVHGRNGIGKTTLLRIAAGMIRADAGRVSLHGLDPKRDRRRYQRRVGFLSAGNSGVYARVTVRFQLEYWARVAFVAPEHRADAIQRAIDQFSMGALADQRCDRLSLGQRQRLRLAMTFLHDPKVILLDEPTNSLDDEGKGVLNSAVEGFASDGGSVLWCAPSAEGVGLPCDRAYVMQEGKLIES